MFNILNDTEADFPGLLRKTPNHPEKVYYEGQIADGLFTNCLAVVGSRNCTEYGKRITRKLVSEIASRGVTIVSGFMYGIDSFAHEACVEVGGKTIAVLPYGIDFKVPTYQQNLKKRILSTGGVIMSEYQDKTPPQNWSFVQRNRIVVGLSKAVLIVEGAKDSGSMVTASLAKAFGRKIFAVAGHLDSQVSQGVNSLIKEGSAEFVTCSKDICSYFDIADGLKTELFSKNINVNSLDKRIMRELSAEPLSVDQLVLKLKVSSSEVSISLTNLLLSNYLVESRGVYYVSEG